MLVSTALRSAPEWTPAIMSVSVKPGADDTGANALGADLAREAGCEHIDRILAGGMHRHAGPAADGGCNRRDIDDAAALATVARRHTPGCLTAVLPVEVLTVESVIDPVVERAFEADGHQPRFED